MFKGHRILYVLTITILFLTAGFTACQGSNWFIQNIRVAPKI